MSIEQPKKCPVCGKEHHRPKSTCGDPICGKTMKNYGMVKFSWPREQGKRNLTIEETRKMIIAAEEKKAKKNEKM